MGVATAMACERAGKKKGSTSTDRFIPDTPLPEGCDNSSLEPCQNRDRNNKPCRGHLTEHRLTRVNEAGESEPVYHRSFELVHVLLPELSYVVEDDRQVLDIWPLLFRRPRESKVKQWLADFVPFHILRVWLCRDCFDAAHDMGVDAWAAQWRWRANIREEAREDIDRLGWPSSPSGDAMRAVAYLRDEDGNGVGPKEMKLPPTDKNSLMGEIATGSGLHRDASEILY